MILDLHSYSRVLYMYCTYMGMGTVYCIQIVQCVAFMSADGSAHVWKIALYQTDAVVQHLNNSSTSSQTCLPNRSDSTIEPSSPSTTESDHNYSPFCCYSGGKSDCASCSKENDRRLLSRSISERALSLCVQVCGSWYSGPMFFHWSSSPKPSQQNFEVRIILKKNISIINCDYVNQHWLVANTMKVIGKFWQLYCLVVSMSLVASKRYLVQNQILSKY